GVLLDVGVDLAAADAVLVLAGEAVSVAVPLALGPDERLGDVIGAPLDLPGHAQDVGSAREFVVDREVVVALAALRLGVDLAAAHADGADGVGAEGPAGDVEVVHVLLDEMVAAEPEVVVPVADLVLGIAPALLTLARPDVALVPVDPGRDEVAQDAVADPLEALDVAGLVAALGAGDDRQALLLGFFGGGEHPADAGPV